MAVYVDDMNIRADVPDGGTVVHGRWSHLFADTEDELRAFAQRIGLNQAWIQHPGQPHVHFDVTGRMRQRAIAAGARPVTWRQAGEFFAGRAGNTLSPAGAPVTSLLLVSGPREGVSKETVRAALAPRFAATVMLVAGGARGVDTYAAQLWREWGGLVEEHPVPAGEWGRNPRGAGRDRNARMVERVKIAGGSVLVIDLPCTRPGCPRPQPHNTHGTSGCARLAEQAGLPVEHYQAPSAEDTQPPPGRTPQPPAPDKGSGGGGGADRGRALRQTAHLYLGHGLLPVPGWGAGANGACQCPRGVACPRPGKHPRSVHVGPGERDYSWKPLACRTHDEVEQRFAGGGPYASGNLMLAIPPGMLVIDQDDDDGGPQAIATLTAQYGDLPPTLGHRTPHGVHRMYRTPPGWTGRAWVGKDTGNPLPPGVDLRVPGQILMAAPSHVPADGELAAYGPVAATAVAKLPAAYLAAWTPPQPETVRRAVPVPPDRAGAAASYVHARVEGIAADLAHHEPGGRGTAIYTAALKIGSTLGAARATPGAGHTATAWTDQAAEDTLMQAAEANGYVAKHGTAAARSAIRSGLRNGLRNPRPLPDFTTSQTAHQEPAARTRRTPGRAAEQPGQAQPAGTTAATGPEESPGTGRDGTAQTPRETRSEATVEDTIAAVLATAGYPASSPRRDTGWSEGFRVHPQPGGTVVIGHEAVAETIGGVTAGDRVHQMTSRYARTLQAAGYQVTSPAPGSLTITPQPGDRQPSAAVSPDRATRATRAAIAADQAYRARDFDRARQLIGQATDLDPSRTGLWDQHRAEITAKQLFIQATAATAAGDHGRAKDLLAQCRELDPRMEARWHRHLTGIRNGQATSQPGKPATERAASNGQHHDRRTQPTPRERATSEASGPQWPTSPARLSSPVATSGRADTQPETVGDREAPGTAERGSQRARRSDALEPERHQVQDQHENQTRHAAAAQQQPQQISHDTETAPCPQCGHSYLRPAGETGPCLSCQTQARLKAAGYTPDSHETQQIAEWNRAVRRRGDRQQETPQHPEAHPSEPDTPSTAEPGEAGSREREKEACG